MKKVIVLLSTYNGEKYIRAQIDSILNQSYKNIEIYVRDDGSKDNTVQILEEYEAKNLIKVEKGKNCGFIKSFLWLVENADAADYYAFSDQDDVWFENKIEMALEKLEAQPDDIPILYFSNYDFYDGNLNFLAHHDAGNPNISFSNSVVDCVSLGFNSVFNYKTKAIIEKNIPENSCGHDWWVYMICAGMGNVIYDKRATTKYRRHGNNVSDGGDSFIKFLIWRFKKFFLGDYFTNIRKQICEYRKLYGNNLSDSDKKFIGLFFEEGIHPLATLKKVFYPHKLRQKIVDELFLRIVFLIGKL